MKKTVQEYLAAGLERPYAEYFAAGRRRIMQIIPHKDFTLELIFDNGERRRLDMRPQIQPGTVWEPLGKWEVFSRVFLDELRAPAWDIDPNVDSQKFINNRLDCCPDVAYVESVPYE